MPGRALVAIVVIAGSSWTSACGGETDGSSPAAGQRGQDASVDASTAEGGIAPGCPVNDGITQCGASCTSCRSSTEIPGGTYFRTYDSVGPSTDWVVPLAVDGGATGEADPATISTFRLDTYLVTVGRFRAFVKASRGGYTPSVGSGKHAYLNGGQGLVDVGISPAAYEPGWLAANDANVALADDNLTNCDEVTAEGTWTSSPGANEDKPINCLTWQEAYAFCIWDGGFLPSEAEWEYAAAGGQEQREFPWGSAPPGKDNRYAIYDCDYQTPGGPDDCPLGAGNIAPVGAATLGAARWGQMDMAGDLYEWTLDIEATYVDPCTDCVALGGEGAWVLRGGTYGDVLAASLVVPLRYGASNGRYPFAGVRCARAP